MSWNTPTQLANNIGLEFIDFDDGENRFQEALDTANAILLFRLGVFEEDTSFSDRDPFGQVRFNAATTLRTKAEWKKAGAIIYRHKAQNELQFGESGNPLATPDGLNIGAFTPEKNVQAAEYNRRASEMEQDFETIMLEIMPNSNLPYVSVALGYSDFTDDGSHFGSQSGWK